MGDLQRRWVLGSALVETLLFSGCLLGWNSLGPILVKEGLLAHDCSSDGDLRDEGRNDTAVESGSNGSSVLESSPSSGSAHLDFCPSQEQYLNLVFSAGSFFLSGSFLPLQLLLGYAQLRSLRQIAGALMSVSCLMLAYTFTNPRTLSLFLPFAVVAQGVGGACLLFSSLMLPSFLPDVGPFYRSLIIGSFTASASVFTLMKVIYNSGIPFVPIILVYGALSCAMFLNSFFCWSLKQKTTGEENMYRVRNLNLCEAMGKKKQEKKEWCQTSLTQKFRSSLRDRERILSQRRTLRFQLPEPGSATPRLQSSLLSPAFIFHLLSDSILLTWIYFYIASLDQQLQSVTKLRPQAGLFSSVFGALQILSLLAAPLLSFLLPNQRRWWKVSTQSTQSDQRVQSTQSGQSGQSQDRVSPRSPCEARRLAGVYLLRVLLLWGFGVTCLIPSLALQAVAFILHVVIRTSTFMLSSALCQCLFHKDHFGLLLGIHTGVTSLLSLVQHPLFLLLIGPLHSDPYWIHSAFLTLSLVSVALPLYLIIRNPQKKHHRGFSRPIQLHPLRTAALYHL